MLWQLRSGEISISGTDTRNVGDVRVMQIRSLHSMHVYLASASSNVSQRAFATHSDGYPTCYFYKDCISDDQSVIRGTCVRILCLHLSIVLSLSICKLSEVRVEKQKLMRSSTERLAQDVLQCRSFNAGYDTGLLERLG